MAEGNQKGLFRLSIINQVVILILSWRSSLYILDTRPLLDIMICKLDFSHFVDYLFTFFIVYYVEGSLKLLKNILTCSSGFSFLKRLRSKRKRRMRARPEKRRSEEEERKEPRELQKIIEKYLLFEGRRPWQRQKRTRWTAQSECQLEKENDTH